MNILQKFLVWLREEGTAGEFLYSYETSRYAWTKEHQSITVPPDAETLADVSFYQAGMDWSKYPHRAAIIRIGQGPWKDTSFETFYQQAKCALGGYVFFDDRYSPEAHRDMVVSAMAGKSFAMEVFIDVERSYGGAFGGPANVRKLIQLLLAAGIKCKSIGVYTGYYYWKSFSSGMSASDAAFFTSVPLWLAWYASASAVLIPSPWTTWTHWQYGTPVVQWGQPTLEIDANRHNGTAAEFGQRYLGGVQPPPSGGDMYYEVSPTGDYVSIRAPHPDSHIQGSKIGQINIGTKAKASEVYEYPADKYVSGILRAKAGDKWYLIYENNGVIVSGWSAEIHLGIRYANVVQVGTPPPPAGDSFVATVIIEDTTTGKRYGLENIELPEIP